MARPKSDSPLTGAQRASRYREKLRTSIMELADFVDEQLDAILAERARAGRSHTDITKARRRLADLRNQLPKKRPN